MDEQEVHDSFWTNEASSPNFREPPKPYFSFAEPLLYADNPPPHFIEISEIRNPYIPALIRFTWTSNREKHNIDWRKEGF